MSAENDLLEYEERVLVNKLEEELLILRSHGLHHSNNACVACVAPERDLIEKNLLLDVSYAEALKKIRLEGSVDRIQPFTDLMNHLNQELHCLQVEMSETAFKMKEELTEKQVFLNNIVQLNEMVTSKYSGSDDVIASNMDTIERNVSRCFMKEKAELKSTLNTLFPDNLSLQDLMGDLVQHYCNEGPEKYLLVSDKGEVMEQLETLRAAGLVKLHCRDPCRVRLAQLT